jgi:uncharacterized repeat protein (TIGR01451 family)
MLKLTIPLAIGLLLVATVLAVTRADHVSSTIDVNGLYWADGDHEVYILSSAALGDRGFLYVSPQSSSTVAVLVRVSFSVSDNVYSPTKTSYVADIGVAEGYAGLGWDVGHDLPDLVGSDHLEIFMRCDDGNDAWAYSWIQDLVYDANNNHPGLPNPDYDWRSDQHGPDGSTVVSSDPTNHPVPASGVVITSHSSLEHNLEASSWILSHETGQSTNYGDWMSPDVAPKRTLSLTVPPTDVNAVSGVHEDYPFFLATGAAPSDVYAWSVNYEMLVDTSACAGQPVYFGVPAAHNSPSKDGNEDVEIASGEPVLAGGNPELQIHKDDGDAIVAPGDAIRYTIYFTNAGNRAANGVALTETVPAYTTFSPTLSSPGWNCPANVAGAVCTLPYGTMPPDYSADSVTFAVEVDDSVPAGVSHVDNTVEIHSEYTYLIDHELNPFDNWSRDLTLLGPDIDLQISKQSATDAQLTWTVPGAGCQADLHEAAAPFFTPVTPAYPGVTAPYVVPQRLGDAAANYFFLVRVTCGAASAASNRVGEFDFDIVPGN